jgi:hypothetical protein
MARAAVHHGTLIVTFALITAMALWAQQEQASDSAQQQSAPELHIGPESLPKPMLGEKYEQRLETDGGTAPFTWSVEKGELPPGIQLQPDGTLAGTPTSAGDYIFTVAVEDSSAQPARGRREFRVHAQRPLMLAWTSEPHPDGTGITGAAEVSNDSKDAFDLTFIVLAVNEYGEAFALGYQRLTLEPDQSQKIDFNSSVPAGTYNVHADAVAEIPSKNLIRRAWIETAAPLVMSSQP